VLSFALAYWSAKAGHNELHALLGYFLTALIASRLLWGFYGSRHARFSDFVHSPATVARYLKAIVSGHPRRFLGHNPAGGIMVLALLVALLTISISGLIILAVIDFDGPLLGLLGHALNDHQAYAVRELHALAVDTVLVMVALHLLGVILASFQHKENLVRAMITGDKDGEGVVDVTGGLTAASNDVSPPLQTPLTAYTITVKRH